MLLISTVNTRKTRRNVDEKGLYYHLMKKNTSTKKFNKAGHQMSSLAAKKSRFHAECAHFTEGFLKANSIKNPCLCKAKENLMATKKKEANKALDVRLRTAKKTIQAMIKNLDT